MSLVVNHNMMAAFSARHIQQSYNRLSRTTEHLSTGLRIQSAADDPAGLAIRELMRRDIAVLNQGLRNASDAVSLLQTADGAMSVIDEKLIRMKELAEQAATGTYTTAQRQIMNNEYQTMASEIDRIANSTDFNGVKLLNGDMGLLHGGSGLKVHFGVGNEMKEDYYFINIGDMRATTETGLRVGNSDARDVWRTTALDAISPEMKLINNGAASDGVFGLRYSDDFDPAAESSATWNMFGYLGVDVEQDSIGELVNRINQGSQARGTVSFANASSLGVQNLTVTVGGQVYAFTTANTLAVYNGPGAASQVGVGSWNSAVTIASQFSAILNANYSSTGVFAAVEGTTVHLFAAEFGEGGNNLGIAASSPGLALSGGSLAGGGDHSIEASVFYDEKTGGYELQLARAQGGQKRQVQIFAFTDSTLGGHVIRGGGASVGWANNTFTSITDAGGAQRANLTNYLRADEDSEWEETQNSSGRTQWDGADVLTQSAAQRALEGLAIAFGKKDSARAELGALQSRMENTITNLQIQAQNLQAAESHYSDVDVAEAMTDFTMQQVITQAAVAMLAQANAVPELALTLIGV